ncbi:MAG: chromosome segregation protein SMC, partial [Rhodobacterales bacterium]|nr:chromosome segregation protein SMC [Rhodobacterales bacterium]
RAEHETLPDTQALRAAADGLRVELAEARTVQADRRATRDALARQSRERAERLQAIGRERTSWIDRQSGANERMRQLAERREQAAADLERLAGLPAQIEEKRTHLANAIDGAERRRKTAADDLAAAENRVAEAERLLKALETELVQGREAMIRLEGAVQQDMQAVTGLAERIAERLNAQPEDMPEIAGLTPDADLPPLEAVESRLERLLRERETMGPVNLRAEQEAAEQREQIDTLELERGDLIKAIDKLRQGINELNREGRQRLLASFQEVDAHFQKLFVRLFGGGQAHLELIESDDPLQAGLEIMASPPGKRLQVLSLLSGGEQALTALALLFAVFLTNPAPICVLDEVDAPLDDANVDRFCRMLHEMAESGETRFLVITHHRMTMARMDRLFGVTMAERGVSQLVSVDLHRAEALREAG